MIVIIMIKRHETSGRRQASTQLNIYKSDIYLIIIIIIIIIII